MSVTSSNSSSNNICRYCNVDLVVGTNTNRKEKKTCNDCLAKTKELKTEKPNTIKCNKCLLYKDNMEFYKILKNCVSCRSKTTKNRNKRNGKEQEADYSTEAANVTIKQIFLYLRDKYDVKESLEQVIREIEEAIQEEAPETEESED